MQEKENQKSDQESLKRQKLSNDQDILNDDNDDIKTVLQNI